MSTAENKSPISRSQILPYQQSLTLLRFTPTLRASFPRSRFVPRSSTLVTPTKLTMAVAKLLSLVVTVRTHSEEKEEA